MVFSKGKAIKIQFNDAFNYFNVGLFESESVG